MIVKCPVCQAECNASPGENVCACGAAFQVSGEGCVSASDAPPAVPRKPRRTFRNWLVIAAIIALAIGSCVMDMVRAVAATGEIRKAAEQGDVEAQNELGLRYLKGDGVIPNGFLASRWFLKAAKQGYAPAQYNFGRCYATGDGGLLMYSEAVEWYRKAAEQGYAKAQNELGVCYADGLGVEKDPAEAVKWYRMAAEQGDALAQCNLGVCYKEGKGVEKDRAEAAKWFHKAAEQGFQPANGELANLKKGEEK